jgi:hypothetical protein
MAGNPTLIHRQASSSAALQALSNDRGPVSLCYPHDIPTGLILILGDTTMKKMVLLAALVFSTACVAQAQNVVGDWQGTLKAGTVELRVVVHITKGDDGSLKATMDSPDQGARGIPVTSVSLKNSELTFSVEAVNGSYEGKVNAAGTEIVGTWYQGQSLPLDLKRGTIAAKVEHKPAKPSDIDGTWLGSLDTGASTLHVAFHITNTEDGLMATMDSLDQGAKGIPVTAVTRNGSSLKMELKGIGGTFEGQIDKSLTTIDGTWTQGNGNLPLVLKRQSATTPD